MTRTMLAVTAALAVLAIGIAGGCGAPADHSKASATPGPQPQQPISLEPVKSKDVPAVLQQSFAAFEQKQYDAAMAGAERVLAGSGDGRGAAEAHYLRGRVFEERAIEASAAGNPTGARQSLQSAREAYNSAMRSRPTPAVEGNVRAGIANVAYFQDDYATAIAEGTAAYQKITELQTKAWVLYRIGLSQQRFGNFAEADQTFAGVQQQFAGTEPARRAAAHQGAKGFQVQVGVFTTPANADSTLLSLRSMGIIGTKANDTGGRTVVRVGPAPNYEQAKILRTRIASKYPDAVIIP